MDRDTCDRQKVMTWDDIIQAVAAVIRPIVRDEVQAAFVAERKRQEAEERKKGDRRRYNAKLVLEHYRSLKNYLSTAAGDIREELEDAEGQGQAIADLMSMCERWEIKIKSIEMTAARTYRMMRHIDTQLKVYRMDCEASEDEQQQRRWRVIHARYIDDVPCRTTEIAANEYVDVRTIQRDIETALSELGPRFFGVDALEFK